MKERDGYTAVQIGLHWLIALLVILAWFTSEGMGQNLRAKIEGTYTAGAPLHVILGISVLVLMIIRLVVRWMSGAPGPVAGTTEALAKARHWGHLALYLLLILVPIGGMATWGGEISQAGDVHALFGNLLLLIAGGHAVIALWHHYARHDGTLRRMMRPGA